MHHGCSQHLHHPLNSDSESIVQQHRRARHSTTRMPASSSGISTLSIDTPRAVGQLLAHKHAQYMQPGRQCERVLAFADAITSGLGCFRPQQLHCAAATVVFFPG